MSQPNQAVAEANVKAARGGGIDFNAARMAAAKEAKLMNNSRYIPPMLDMVRQLSEDSKIYIYNVGPWPQQRLLGSLGTYIVRECPDGKEYGEPVELPGIVSELYPINEGEYKRTMEDGMAIAMQILGVGPFLSPHNSFVPYGVFISRSNPPKKEEILEAKKNLRQKFLELVAEADLAFSQGPKMAEETIRPETHYVAARALRKTEAECPWLRNSQLPAERAECPGCGTVYKIGIIKCRDCGFILDKRKYDEAVKGGMFAA